MKKRILFGFCFVLGCGSESLATTGSSFEMAIGSELTKFSYVEPQNPSDSEKATYESLLADIKWHPIKTASNIELRYENARGVKSQYSGFNLLDNSPGSATDNLTFTSYQVDLNMALTDTIFIYVGYAWNNWNRFQALGTGYTEIYTWNYTPVGMRAWIGRASHFDYGVDFSLRPTSHNKVQLITSNTYPNGQNSQTSLSAKTGFRFMIPIRWYFSSLTLDTSPWFEQSQFGQGPTFSNSTLYPSGSGYVPSSTTTTYGIEVTLNTSF